jgi:hypothetical protein
MDEIKNIVSSVLRSLQTPEGLRRKRLAEAWSSIVGAAYADQTRPALAKNGRLTVWVEKAALAFELNQKYKQNILKRAQGFLGEKAVKEVSVRVGQLR